MAAVAEMWRSTDQLRGGDTSRKLATSLWTMSVYGWLVLIKHLWLTYVSPIASYLHSKLARSSPAGKCSLTIVDATAASSGILCVCACAHLV